MDNYPPGQIPTRATTPPIITHQDNYPPRTITAVGQLPPRAISPIHIAKTTTPKGNYPHRKSLLHNLKCTAFTEWEYVQYFRVVGILGMVEIEGDISSLLPISKFNKQASVKSFLR